MLTKILLHSLSDIQCLNSLKSLPFPTPMYNALKNPLTLLLPFLIYQQAVKTQSLHDPALAS